MKVFLLRFAISLSLMAMGASAFAFGGSRDDRVVLADDEYEAFEAAHSNEVCFLGVNMYSQGSVYRSMYQKRMRNTGIGSTWIIGSDYEACPVVLSHTIFGHTQMMLCFGKGNDDIVYLAHEESVPIGFAHDVERCWVEKVSNEIAAWTGIPLDNIEVFSNKVIRVWGTNTTLKVRIESDATQIYVGPSSRAFGSRHDDWRDATFRQIMVTPLFKRKTKPIPKASETPDPAIEVDI